MYQNKKQKQKGGNIKERKWESKHKNRDESNKMKGVNQCCGVKIKTEYKLIYRWYK